MTANEMVAYALEAPTELLPFLPELLADLDELGSDAEQIAGVLRDLALPPTASVVDLGCGKGATAMAIASELGLRVLGIELFEPFVAHAAALPPSSGRHRDGTGTGATPPRPVQGLPPADVAVFAALGDVLGDPAETMRVVRQYVRPRGYVILADVFLREGGSVAFPGFERYRSRVETVRGLTVWGDELLREVLEIDHEDDDSDEDAAAIHRRASALAEQHPEHRDQLLAFANYQAKANAHIAENLVDAVWVLQRSTT